MARTVRTMVADAQREILAGDLMPERARQLLAVLTALLGNCNDEIRQADAEYAKTLLHFLEQDEAASRAKIRAEASPEYLRKRQAHDLHELCLELTRSLKVILRSIDEEMRLSR